MQTNKPPVEIVAAVAYHDEVYIFTRNGDVYRMWISHSDQLPRFERIYQF